MTVQTHNLVLDAYELQQILFASFALLQKNKTRVHTTELVQARARLCSFDTRKGNMG